MWPFRAGELVVERDVAETHRSDPHYADLFETMVATGPFEAYVHDGRNSIPVTVVDGTVQIVVAEGEEPRALLETDDEALREWADRTYERYRAEADPLE